MIIFTGTGRSGTKLYAMLFDAHHEYQVDRLKAILEREIPDLDATPGNPVADPALRRRIMEEHLADVDLATFRDSSNPYIHFLDAIHAMDPDVRIVLGVRDGRDFVRSGVSRGYHASARQMALGMKPTRDDPLRDAWDELGAIQKVAWQWVNRNHIALDYLAAIPREKWTLVRLEDLTSSPKRDEHMTRLEDFVGRKAERVWLDVKVNTNNTFALPPKEQWPEDWNRQFFEIAGPMSRRLGYDVPEQYAAAIGPPHYVSPATIRRNTSDARAT